MGGNHGNAARRIISRHAEAEEVIAEGSECETKSVDRMDKNKSRTDLLAAGRKKLQQYRQKKDNKGGSSRGKSSKKSGKSEQPDSVEEASTAESEGLRQVLEGEVDSHADPSLENAGSSVSNSLVSSDSVGVQSTVVTPVTATDDTPFSDAGVDESTTGSSYINEVESAQIIDDEMKRAQSSETSDVQDSVREMKHSDVPVEIDCSNEMAADFSLETVDPSMSHSLENTVPVDTSTPVSPQPETLGSPFSYNAEILENYADSSTLNKCESAQIIGDETGRVQSLEISGIKDSDREMEHQNALLTVDGSRIMTFPAEMGHINVEEGKGSLPSQEDVRDMSLVHARAAQVTDVGEMQEAGDLVPKQFDGSCDIEFRADQRHSLPKHGEHAEAAGRVLPSEHIGEVEASQVNPSDGADDFEVKNQCEDVSSVDPHNAGQLEGSPDQTYQPEESFVFVNTTQERPTIAEVSIPDQGYKSIALENDYPVNFSQLLEVIKGLSEDEYKLLIESRGSFSNTELGSTSVVSPDHDLGLVDRLREELFITSCTKDILQLQLSEHFVLQTNSDQQIQRLDDEMSDLRASLKESNERNDYLSQELAHSFSELQAAVNQKEELHNQFHVAKAEIEELSTRCSELQNNLEMSQSDLLSKSKESADSNNLVAALQADIANLNGVIASLTKERELLLEEKDSWAHENGILLKELADCKNVVAASQVESSDLSITLSSVREEIEKIKGEKEQLGSWNDNLSMELSDCKNLVEALQVERAVLNGNLALVSEERNQLEEDKKYSIHENKQLSSELLVLRERLCEYERGCLLLEAQQNEFTADLEQLWEENIFLNCCLDIHKSLIQEIKEREAHTSPTIRETTDKVGNLQVLNRHYENAADNELPCGISRGQDAEPMSDGLTGGLLPELFESGVFNRQLEEAMKLLQELDLVFEGINPLSINRATSKAGAPQVSKLIQAFESKVIEDQSPVTDEFALTKTCVGNLKLVLRQMALDGERANLVFKLEQEGRSAADLTNKELKGQYGALMDHSDNLETEYLELCVLYEAVKQNLFVLKEKNNELETLCEMSKQQDDNLKAENHQLGEKLVEYELRVNELHSQLESAADLTNKELKGQYDALVDHSDNLETVHLELCVLYESVKQNLFVLKERSNELEALCEMSKQQDDNLKAENHQLGEKLIEYELRINELHSQLHELQQSSGEMVSSLRDQLEIIQKDAAERALIVEHEWNSTTTSVIEAVERLDSVGPLLASTISTSNHDSRDIVSHVDAYVNGANKIIEDLKQELKAVRTDHEATLNLFKDVNEKCNDLLQKNESANETLYRLYCDLRGVVVNSLGSVAESVVGIEGEGLPDPVDYSRYKSLVEQLENFLAERLELQSQNNKLNMELMSQAKDAEEMRLGGLDLGTIQRLINGVEEVVQVEGSDMDSDRMHVPHLESLVSVLVFKYKEANAQLSLFGEEIRSKVVELTDLQDMAHQLTALKLQHESEILVLKEGLTKAEESLVATRSEFQEKVTELEQSEHRLSSIREKLSIAVAKGKGLIVQRDNLKQSLAETSSELERCSEELQMKDLRLHELESKLKTYSEAGERVESLESELSYIRNSATAIRESFLLKDSVLQRIEEILEDLELPEHFHSRDIIEKVDWLARSVTGNSLPPADWEQKSSAGGSYSDTGLAVMDAWKEDNQPTSNLLDDLRIKYEDIQNKFYGLAEQNEMLEQSLVERNHLVQRWEELLDTIDMPSHLRSAEVEDRIEWLSSALSEANSERQSLLRRMDKLENYCGSLTADLEESQKRVFYLNSEVELSQKKISDLQMDLEAATSQSENFSERLEFLTRDHEKLSVKEVQLELENKRLLDEVTGLQEKLVQKLGNEELIQNIEGEMRRLEDLVCDALQVPSSRDLVSDASGTECLEGLLRKLIENYKSLSSMKSSLVDGVQEHNPKISDSDLVEVGNRGTQDAEESDVTLLKSYVDTKEPNVDFLEEEREKMSSELVKLRDERDGYAEKQQLLLSEVDTLEKRRMELQELLSQEEQKSNSLREKLNIAVRKGKSLVQHRDGLKQTIDEMTAEVEHLKSEIKLRDSAIADYELKTGELTTHAERIKALESDHLLLTNRLAETEHLLQEKGHMLNLILTSLGNFNVGSEIGDNDPIQKLEDIGKLCYDLRSAVASSEQECRKSSRAAELLLAELNEVQDRNDGLQEDLAQATIKLAELSKERDIVEAARLEALSSLEKLSTAQFAEKSKQYSEFSTLKFATTELQKSSSLVRSLLGDVLSKELELLQDLEASMESCLNGTETKHEVQVPIFHVSDIISSSGSENKENTLSMDMLSESHVPDHFDDKFIIQVCSAVHESVREVGSLKLILNEHSVAIHEQASSLSKLMSVCHSKIASQKESFDAMKRDIKHMELIGEKREQEIASLNKNISLLYETCTSSIMEMENIKDKLLGNASRAGGLPFGVERNFLTEEHIKSVTERLLLVLKDFGSLKGEIVEGNRNEMKMTISNLQKELQEKDIQRERICTDLVTQIKEAEAALSSYSLDLQSSRSRVHDLEQQVASMDEERNLLVQRVNELQDEQAISADLQGQVQSLTVGLAAKDQEIEALMQALDEEEAQMEELTNKVKELEKVAQQKNSDIENLEASRGKVMKKLSITVGKFDELHHFSEGLLEEVEKLQSQLQDRDAEISFLRQEVTRCTGDLVASQLSIKRNSDEMHELLTWLDTLFAQAGLQDVEFDSGSQFEHREILQMKITSILSKLEDVKTVAQSRDAILQTERSKVEELRHKVETLERSVSEKDSRLNMLESVEDVSQPGNAASEITEVEPVINKWTVPGPSTTSQVRSLRKINNDQVAIAIDMDNSGSSRLEDEDDDKVHGFKSLTTSRIVPKFTRPISDMVDGLWVSCDRALMRQPALRLAIILYWALIHALVAMFVV